jgi:predicted transcriptional regulator
LSKRKAVQINKKTLKIAANTKDKRFILYLWVAINRRIFEGEDSPTITSLADECGTNNAKVRESIQWLQENNYLRVNELSKRKSVYAIA